MTGAAEVVAGARMFLLICVAAAVAVAATQITVVTKARWVLVAEIPSDIPIDDSRACGSHEENQEKAHS